MATSSNTNKMEQQPPDWALLQLDVAINQVNWSHVRHYMTERFSHPPTSFVQRQGRVLHDHVDPCQICDHILKLRPCPSFFDAYQPCKMFHPEFILQDDILLWTPRTWTCHAYQRRRDLWKRCWNCEIPHCGQLHRQGWEHSEMFGFRAWMASVEPRFWYSVYCLEPNYSGRLPLYTIDFQDLQNCLATQPFITPELHSKHAWKDAVPPPPTYIMEVPSRVHPLVSNYNEPEHVHRRKMLHRDPTPRRHRSTPRDVTPQRRDPFLSAHAPSDQSQPDPSPRFGPGTPPRSRQPTGSENWATQHLPSCHFWSSDQFWPLSLYNELTRASTHCSTIVKPGAHSITIICCHASWPCTAIHRSRVRLECWIRPWFAFAASRAQDFAQPCLGSANIFHRHCDQCSQLVHQDHPTTSLSRPSYTFMTGGSEKFAPFADWQLPSRLLEDNFRTFRSSNQDPGSNVAMTDWGVLFRQRSLYSNRGEYEEQTLTIPLPTNTADPELSILTSFFYMKMQRELSLAFSRSTASAQTITQAQLRDWLKFSGDHHRLARTQQGVAQQFNDNVANVVLDIINANIPHYQRSWADSDRNITVDQVTSRLRFCSWEANAVSRDMLPRLLTPGEDQPRKLVHRFTASAVVNSRWGSTKEYVVFLFHFCRSLTPREQGPCRTDLFLSPVTRDVVSSYNLFPILSLNSFYMIVLIFDDWTLSHNPHHFAYMPTFDTTECQLEKRDERVLRQQTNTHDMSFSVPNGQRPRMRQLFHLRSKTVCNEWSHTHTCSFVCTLPFLSFSRVLTTHYNYHERPIRLKWHSLHLDEVGKGAPNIWYLSRWLWFVCTFFRHYSITRLDLFDLRPHERWHHLGHQPWQRPLQPTAQLLFNRWWNSGQIPSDKTYSHWWITPQWVLWWPPCPWNPIHHPHGTPGLQQLEIHPSPTVTNHQGRAWPHPTALLWWGHLQPFEYDIPYKLCQVHARFLRCGQHLHRPEVAMPILQKAVCQALPDADVPKAPSPHWRQHLPVLLGMPTSSQWPWSHDPPRSVAQHDQGVRGCQPCPSPWPFGGLQPTLGPPILWRRLWCWLCSFCVDSISRWPSPGLPWGDLQPFLGQPTEPLAPYLPHLHRYPRPILYSGCQPIPKPYRSHLEEPVWQKWRRPSPVLLQVRDLCPGPQTNPEPISRPRPKKPGSECSRPWSSYPSTAFSIWKRTNATRSCAPLSNGRQLASMPASGASTLTFTISSIQTRMTFSWSSSGQSFCHRSITTLYAAIPIARKWSSHTTGQPMWNQANVPKVITFALPASRTTDPGPCKITEAIHSYVQSSAWWSRPNAHHRTWQALPPRVWSIPIGRISITIYIWWNGLKMPPMTFSRPSSFRPLTFSKPMTRPKTRLPSCTTIRTQLQKPNPSLHEKGILEPRPYRRAWGPKPPGRIRDLCHPFVAQGRTCPWQATILRLVCLWVWGGRDPCPEAWTSDQADGSHLLPPPGIYVRQRQPPRTQTDHQETTQRMNHHRAHRLQNWVTTAWSQAEMPTSLDRCFPLRFISFACDVRCWACPDPRWRGQSPVITSTWHIWGWIQVMTPLFHAIVSL